MTKYRIPTAGYAIFTDCIEAKDYLDGRKYPVVVKADGLAAGKGVVICKSRGEADAAVDMMLKRKKYGGDAIVIEDFLAGEEASFIVITDGETICPLPTSQDHKAVYDGDEGPNTGGMGAYSPAPVVNDALQQKIISEIVMPTIEGMKTEGRKFSGFLYAGLMISEGRPYVLEYNVRCGDPEAQPIMMRLSSDLVPIIEAAAGGTLGEANAEWDRRPAVSVVMASKGYPGNYEKGMAIKGIEEASALEGVAVFHSGTKRDNGNWLTDGRRVLSVTTVGENLQRAIANAYEAVGKITWSGAHYRKDIGKKALKYVAEGQMALL
jgi:phosphoribosylamine--glycine ligase